MAVKITRQPDKIALLGAPTSAAAMSPGHERAPAALRAAGLVDRLRSVGFDVVDHGDDPVQLSQADPESPRARNLPRIVKSLEDLRPRVEAAVKSGALPIILTGDCTIALATVAGVRRYFHNVSMIYLDRDADLNIPATTPSGCVDGMVVAHLTGRGAAELVRFWGEPPLVRDPDIALFGVDRFDPPEEEMLRRAPIRSFPASEVKRRGAAATARLALERIHASRNEFILHFDVDVIEDFQATNYPGSGGLRLDEVREALEIFVRDKHLAAIDLAAYNPEKDPDGSGAKLVIDLLASALAARREALATRAPEAAVAATASAPSAVPAMPPASLSPNAAPITAGEAWSSDDLEPVDEASPVSELDDSAKALSNESSEAAADEAAAGESEDSQS
ncbi:MAG: arginase family protein [Candidatus Acidiferrales bacterium]